MARYRGSQGKLKVSGESHQSKKSVKKKDKDSDGEEEDRTSSNGLSGNETTGRHHRPAASSRRPNHHHNGSGKSMRSKVISTSFVAVVVAFVAYYAYLGYLETRISTAFHGEKVVVKKGLDFPDRFWGNYRPGVYFGMKHRSPKSLIGGLMWLLPSQVRSGEPNLRHLCEQGDNLKTYGWIEHDGVNFGVQEIKDHNMKITTSFVKRHGGSNGGDWTARIEVNPSDGKNLPPSNMRDETVLLFYFALESGLTGGISPVFDGKDVSGLRGNTSELGSFSVRFLTGEGVLKTSYIDTFVDSMNDVSSATLNHMATTSVNDRWLFIMKQRNQADTSPSPNLFVYQVHVKGKFSMDIVYESGSFIGRPSHLSGDLYTQALYSYRKNFADNFEEKFHLQKKGFNDSSIFFARAALSNLVGGVGYFSGHSKVQSAYNSAPVPYWSASLYSGVPSRSFFPRGFLWDEGFHLLLMNKWNPEISMDIIGHWLDLMNTEGWIPREQILGEEALSRVPEEYVIQRNDVANPPTLIMALLDLIQRHREWLLLNHKSTLNRMWPRLSTWYHWLNKTQAGEVNSTYRWRGRNTTTFRELNPKTLASGLDDYPRASHPNNLERHLDLRCWMALSSKLMGDLADILGYNSAKYMYTYELLTDEELLNRLHWSKDMGSYADYGLHSDKVALQYPSNPNPSINNRATPPEKIRYVLQPPDYGFINMFGYVSIFPMLLEILHPESSNLKSILKKVDDPKFLWTPYGLRSLAANAPLYDKRNTEHDPPYWRGPIWINMNFLSLKSLKYYSSASGPSKALANEKYQKLRENLISNMINQYYKTGFVWEQYDDATGKGKGCRPFSGWSSLIVLVMSEEY